MTVQKEQAMEPRSENGRFLSAGLEALGFTEDDANERIIAVEDETRAATLDALSEAVKGLDASFGPYGGSYVPGHIDRSAVLTLIDNLRESDRG